MAPRAFHAGGAALAIALSSCSRAQPASNTPDAARDAAPGPSAATAASTTSVGATPAAIEQLPETDDGLPGAGPVRRYDWFRQLWRERHEAWAKRSGVDQRAVVFLGDSITQLWGDDLGGNFRGLKVANRGISGDTTRGMLIRLEPDVVELHPTGVVLLAGTNDLDEHAEPETIAGNMALILTALRASDARLPIVLCEVFPSSPIKNRPKEKIAQLNRLYAALAKEDGRVTLLPTWALFAGEDGNARPAEFPDLLHPNEVGYAKWAGVLRPALARALGWDGGA